MASSSSSGSNSQCRPQKYDVFLSFRGDDTRNTFTDHLYEGLKIRGIRTFKDDIELKYGDPILEELSTAIEESQVALVVFSKDYAASKWCLEELVRIMECNKKQKGQTVMPVFYNVDPSHVRHQRGSFAEAFAKHESNYKDDVEGRQKVEGWRAALWEAANLSGCDTRTRIESECVRDLVGEISKLCKTSLFYLENIVGLNTHLEEVKSRLQMEINDVRIVGIWGMGGVGKTTIARAIFNTHSYQFEAASFLADIKENEKKNQLHSLQNTLLSELLRTKDDHVSNKYAGKDMIQSRFRSMKVLIVLDDINERHHLEYLAEDADWFGYGSRVVVTTRNRDLIMNANAIYEVIPLPDLEAMQLFNQYAFRKEDPDERFKKLSLEVVNHAKGLPLALKLWGCSLHKKDQTRWEIIVDQIKKTPDSDVIQKLKISYDGLKSEEQEIFLDMACFFRGKEKKEVIQILKSCGFGAKYGLDILIDKALVFIDPEYDMIQMHDLIQDMGKYIVKMQKDPGERSRLKDLGERSRLWDAEDIKEVMTNNTGTKAVEAIWRYINPLSRHYFFDDPFDGICFSKEAMENMKMLRILHIRTYEGSACDDAVIEYLSNNLCWFVWHCYPWKSLPTKFEPKKLVHLELWDSKLCQLWQETKHFPCLRYLDLSCSESLMRTPDFREMPNLEYLNLARCTSLEEVDDSLGYCGKLIQCNLSGCSSLKRFPCVNVESLEILNLSGNNFEHLPRSIAQLAAIRSLHLSDCKRLKELPGFMGMPNLESLNLGNCDDLEEVDDSLGYCGKLIRLDLGSCKSLKRFPYVNVESLEFFNLRDCSSLEKFPEIGGRMKPELKIEMKDSGIRELPSSFFKTGTHLTKLDLSFMKHLVSLPSSIGMLKSLVKLNVSDCSKLESLPEEMGDLESLVELNVSDCSKLESLPEEMGDLENLEKLNASYTVISRPPSSIARLNKLKFLSFTKHISQVGFQDGMCFVFPPVNDGLRSLERLCLCYCNLEDEGLPEDIGSLSSLKELSLVGNNFEHLPRSIVQLGALKFLGLSDCERLKELPGFMGMPNLESLNLGNCDDLEEVDDSLGYCGKLIQLDLGSCKSLKRFPCVNVESLEFLNLRDCSSLEKFPEFRGRMKPELMIKMNGSGIRELPSSFFQSGTHLTKLDLSFMKHLVSLPSSIGMLKSLVKLNVSFFSKLESLPEEIGDLENLEKLDASYTLISRPPSSIARLNKLKFLSFTKHISQVGFQDGMCFVFPPVNDGLRSLERLCLSYCNLEDEGLPEDIGSLSSLKELRLRGNNFEHLPRSIAQLGALEYLYLTDCEKLKELPGFMGMPNLEYLNLGNYDDLKEVDDSLGYCGKLIRLYLGSCKSLKMFPCVNVESLEFLNLRDCSSLEKFPEIRGRMKPELKIKMNGSGIRELPSSYFQSGTHLTKLDLSFMKHLVALPSRIGMLKSLVELDVSDCSSLEILPEEIGHLENLERLDAHSTLISRPPSSIVRLNKLKLLNFEKQKSQVGLVDRVNLVFPQVNEGLHSLERLYLSYCNLKDGGLPEDIGSLSSLKELYLNGNNFENLPRSIAQLGALRILDVSDCMKLTQLPEFPQQLDTIDADWSNDWICNSLFQNISSLQHGISASDSLRVFTSRMNIPSWFQHWGIDRSVSVKLPENWYVSDNFLGFVVCYSGSLIETTAQLIPLCDDGMSWMTQKLALSNHSKYDIQIQFFVPNIQFFLVPLAGLWDTSKTNGKTPNDYGLIRLSFSGELKKFGLRLLYKDEPKLGKRQSRYDDSEASSSSCKKQRPHYNINRSFAFENLQQQVEAPVSSETLQLFPTSSGV